jgi:hypothetical protein
MSLQLNHLFNELNRIDSVPKDKKYENIKAYSRSVIDGIIKILNILFPTISAMSFMKDFLISSSRKHANTKQKLNIREFLHYLYKYNYIHSSIHSSIYSSISPSIHSSIYSSISPSITVEPDFTTDLIYYILESQLLISVELDYTNIDYTKIDYTNIDHTNIDYTNIDYTKIDYTNIDYTNIDYTNIDHTNIDSDFIMDEYEYIFMLDDKIRFIILLFLHFKLIKSIKKNYIPDLNIATAQLQINMGLSP